MLLFLVQNIPLLEKFPCQEYPSFEDRKIWVSPPWKTRYPGSVYPFAGNRLRAQLWRAPKNQKPEKLLDRELLCWFVYEFCSRFIKAISCYRSAVGWAGRSWSLPQNSKQTIFSFNFTVLYLRVSLVTTMYSLESWKKSFQLNRIPKSEKTP